MSRLSFLSSFVLLITLITSPVFAGTAYYVDCSAPKNGDGTYASPWNKIASVNSYGFSVGDDVYFKEGTICTPSAGLTIDWDGTSGDRIIIGCYDGKNDFDCSDGGLTRPIIDGNNHTVPAVDYGLIQMKSKALTGYLTVQDMRVNNSASEGISTNHVDYVTVENCYVYQPKEQGILLGRCHDCTASDNIVERSSYNNRYRAGIEVSAVDSPDAVYNVTVKRNTVFGAYECIGVYNGARNVTIEENVVYDCRVVGIYLEASKDCVVRYNLIYESAIGPPDDEDGMYSGIHTMHEDRHCNQGGIYPFGNDGHEIYGNLLASIKNPINLANSE
ncbi:MAG: right-handed parallel beta-helix repeat-containing protein, partial [Candidatus Hodarchaeota archaeon]